MKRIIPLFLILMLTSAQVKWEKFMCCGGTASGGFSCAPSTAFINRTSGESAGTKTALDTFICGLVTDGLMSNTSSGYCTSFDTLWILAQDDSGDALLNVCSASFTLTAHGSPTFSADNGYTGVEASSTVYLDPTFAPSTNGVNFVLNSAHLSVWSATGNISAGGGGGAAIAVYDGTNIMRITNYVNGAADNFFDLNNACCNGGSDQTSTVGQWLVNRTGSGSAAHIFYLNSVNTGLTGSGSSAIPTGNITVLASNNIGVIGNGDGNRLSIVSIGAGLTPTQVTNFCHRENVYLNTVNGTSLGIC